METCETYNMTDRKQETSVTTRNKQVSTRRRDGRRVGIRYRALRCDAACDMVSERRKPAFRIATGEIATTTITRRKILGFKTRRSSWSILIRKHEFIVIVKGLVESGEDLLLQACLFALLLLPPVFARLGFKEKFCGGFS